MSRKPLDIAANHSALNKQLFKSPQREKNQETFTEQAAKQGPRPPTNLNPNYFFFFKRSHEVKACVCVSLSCMFVFTFYGLHVCGLPAQPAFVNKGHSLCAIVWIRVSDSVSQPSLVWDQ